MTVAFYSTAPLSPRYNSTTLTDALLFSGNPSAPPVLNSNVFQAFYQDLGFGPALVFVGVPFVEPGSGTITFRLKNLRVDASAIGPNQQVMLGLSILGNSIPFIPSQIPVAYTAPGVSFALQAAGGTPASSLNFAQAGGSNPQLAGNAFASGGVVNYNLVFREGFSAEIQEEKYRYHLCDPASGGGPARPYGFLQHRDRILR